MKDQRVEFSTAMLAKEKGFDEECNEVYLESGELYKLEYSGVCTNSKLLRDYFINEKTVCTTPTQSLLQRWIRETHNVNISIDYQGIESDSMEYCYIIKYLPLEFSKTKRWVTHMVEIESSQFHINNTYSGFFETYEKVLEEALTKSLNLIIDNKICSITR